jgi:hypothetical protein
LLEHKEKPINGKDLPQTSGGLPSVCDDVSTIERIRMRMCKRW